MEIVILFIAICNFLLGFFVYKSNHLSPLNRWYGIFGFLTGLWVWSNFMTGISSTLFWIQSAYAFGALVPASAIMWISELRREKLSKLKLFFIWFPALIFFIVPYINDLFLTNVTEVYLGGVDAQYGSAFPFYAAYMLGMLFLIIYKLVQGYRKAEKIQKLQLRFILTGVIFWILVVSIVSFILPLLGMFQYTVLDSPASFIFLIFTAYAITKHHLFDIRVIATEMLIFAIWMFLLIRTALSETYQDFIINGGLLMAVIIIGILLIRSVLQEVKQREKLEVMTKRIKKAYEVEKRARKDLERLGRAKSQFIMATQHHLRTPLTSMVGYVDLILTGTYGRVPANLKNIIFKFNISTKRLIRIVNELLDISQFQLGKKVVSLQSDIRIEPILDELMEELKFEAEHKSIYLKLKKPKKILKIKADSEKLKVALFNIVDNAIKYTRKGGVTINIESGQKLKIAIKDTGMGIAKEGLKTLFQHTFERGKEAKEVFATGRGIGLYITYQIIKAHNGKIWAESEGKGKGSTFYIELPVK